MKRQTGYRIYSICLYVLMALTGSVAVFPLLPEYHYIADHLLDFSLAILLAFIVGRAMYFHMKDGGGW